MGKMTPLQQRAWERPWTDDRKQLVPAYQTLPGGLIVGLSLNH